MISIMKAFNSSAVEEGGEKALPERSCGRLRQFWVTASKSAGD